MKIVHVITRFLRAGSEENTVATCLGQLDAGHDVYLAYGQGFDEGYLSELPRALMCHHIEDLVHPLAPLADVRAFTSLKRLFRRIEPHVVHTHQSKAGILGRLAAASAGVPVVVHGVHILPFVGVGRLEKLIFVTAEKAAAAYTHAFVNVSDGVKEKCLAHGIGRPDQHFVVHSGFEIRKFVNAERPDDWEDLLGTVPGGEKPPTVVMLAAFEPRKRHLAFLECIPALLARVPGTRVLLAGDGPLKAQVSQMIDAMGIGENVRVVGFRSDPERLLALADVCALTSIREGLPRVLVQYVAAGRATVITDLPGLQDLIADGNVAVVAPNNVAAAVDCIGDLLLDAERRRELERKAEQTDVSSWSREAMCGSIAAIYSSLTGDNAGTHSRDHQEGHAVLGAKTSG